MNKDVYFGYNQSEIIVANETDTEVNINLTAGSTISGQITDTNGDPIVGATISAEKGYYDYYATSDASGNYTIEIYNSYYTYDADSNPVENVIVYAEDGLGHRSC